MLRFTPSKPGLFAASLQLISAAQKASDGEELNILATVELRGFAEAAALTLKEFCGTQWPSHLPFFFMPGLCVLPGLMAAEPVAPKFGGHPHSAFKAEEVTTAASAEEISAEELAPVGRKMDDSVCFTGAQIFQAIKCLLPRIMDFGCSLVGHCSGSLTFLACRLLLCLSSEIRPKKLICRTIYLLSVISQRGGPPIFRSVVLCNEGQLPIHVVWRHAAKQQRASATAPLAANDISELCSAFSVSPSEAVIPPKGSRSFCFAVNPRMLPTALPDSRSSRSGLFFFEFSLWVGIISLLMHPVDFSLCLHSIVFPKSILSLIYTKVFFAFLCRL